MIGDHVQVVALLAHGALADEKWAAHRASLALRNPCAAKRWIDVERVTKDTLTHAPALAIEQVGRDDLKIVVGGMCEGATTVAVAKRPDAGNVSGEPVVNLDVPARVGLDASRFEAKIVGVRTPAHGEQHMRAD